jgi:hypothetical protein
MLIAALTILLSSFLAYTAIKRFFDENRRP